jgi:hypothetical protein
MRLCQEEGGGCNTGVGQNDERLRTQPSNNVRCRLARIGKGSRRTCTEFYTTVESSKGHQPATPHKQKK